MASQPVLYALAQTHYFNDSHAASNASTVGVLAAMRADSDNGIANTDALHGVAQDFGLKHVVYEGGPDTVGVALRMSPVAFWPTAIRA